MKISLLDRSNYYKGLLVLTGKDRFIDPREREWMLQFGKILDFDRRFCEAAIDDLLGNVYITDMPIVFSNRETAECFLCDAIRLALADEAIHPKELAWLEAVSQANGLNREWLDAQIQRFREMKDSLNPSTPFAIQEFLGAS